MGLTMNGNVLLLILSSSFFLGYPSNSLFLHTSCSGISSSEWNSDMSLVAPNLLSWLHSAVTVNQEKEKEGEVQSMLYQPTTGEFRDHFAHFNDVLKENDHLVDMDRSLITIGKFTKKNRPLGLTWQWRSKRTIEGFLYGHVDSRGQFTGDNITFIYPDLLTGLRGRFEFGQLVEATAVDIVGERCNNGIKELRIRPTVKDSEVKWLKEEPTAWRITKHPLVMDPHERKSVYVGKSRIPGSEEGLFARRDFLPGDIVSYFSGTRTFADDMFFDNMTQAEMSSAGAYFFNLAANSPDWWGYPEDLVLDIPEQFRSIYQFRTTLGHKANHLFVGKNTEYDTVDHPVHGGITCLIATQIIAAGDEVNVDYLYDVDDEDTEPWYKDLYIKTYGKPSRKPRKSILRKNEW